MRLTIIFIIILSVAGSILYLTEDYETKEEAKKIKELEAEKEKERRLEEAFLSKFQKFYDNPNLDTVDLSHMNLQKLPDDLLDSMNNLVYLDLSNNSLSKIPKKYFRHPTLKHINMSRNYFTELSIPRVYGSKIEVIDASYNQISSIGRVSRLDSLKSLNLAGNSIMTLNHNIICDSLEYLDLKYNKLEDLDLITSIPNLKTVIASHNKILNIPELVGNTNLEYLDLSHNEIEYFVVTGYLITLPLKTIILNDNHIEKLEEDVALKALEHLELKNCRLYTLHNIENHHPNLKYLDIRSNSETLNQTDSLMHLTYIDTLLVD